MLPAAGELVTRNVKLVRPLGKGGMGSVWIGAHTTLDTEVAVKFIAPEHADKERFVARFRREASSAAKIKSPHVVQVFDHGITEDGVPYIVMELLRGEPLGRRLGRGRLAPREVGMLVAQVAKVLTLAHGEGVIHRDLKPDNLFLVDSGYELFVKVLDFGIAKQLSGAPSDITDTGAMVGTPHYMSPEMLLSPKDADQRADLWALAVVAYHALTGVLPFRGETLAALSVAVNDGTFAPPSALVSELGPDVDVWFKLALCRSLSGRFSSAGEMAQAFRQALRLTREADSLPDTSRPSAALLDASRATDDALEERVASVSAAAASRALPLRARQEATPERTLEPTQATADPTVTSEQLARIHAGERVSEDDDTAAAGEEPSRGETGRHSTLGGTSKGGEAPRGGWARRAPLAAALLLVLGAGGAVAASLRTTEPAPDTQPVATPEGMASFTPASSTAGGPPPADAPSPATSAGRPGELAPRPSAPTATTVAASSAAAPSSAPQPPPRAVLPPPPAVAPRPPTSLPSTAAPAPKVRCDNPFFVDENGDLQPRPGCF